MPRFSANLSLLFNEHPLEQRFGAAAACGFDAVEIQFPYPLEPSQLRQALTDADQRLVLFNLPAGDWDAGERGIACHPDRQAEFRQGVATALAYADATGCRRINCLAGVPPTGLAHTEALACLRANLTYAAAQLASRGITLCIEAINSRDIPGFLLDRSAPTLEMIQSLRHDNVRLQYDIYHMQIMEGDLSRRIGELLPWIGHIQLADNPGRHQPGTGEINFPYLLNHLDQLGYTGWVGLEYLPLGASADSFEWMNSDSFKLGWGNDR